MIHTHRQSNKCECECNRNEQPKELHDDYHHTKRWWWLLMIQIEKTNKQSIYVYKQQNHNRLHRKRQRKIHRNWIELNLIEYNQIKSIEVNINGKKRNETKWRDPMKNNQSLPDI